MASNCMLSTFDNPFNPFDNFSEWYKFDLEKEHHTCSRIDRIAKLSSEMSQKEVDEEMERAIDFILKYDDENKFVKVWETQTATAVNA